MEQNFETYAGFSETDITPEEPAACQLIGFHRPDNTARGILHRLKAQVLYIRHGSGICCLAAIDSIGFTVALTNLLRDRIAQRLGADRENIMVCFSHTHAAPDAAAGNAAYFHSICPKILDAASMSAACAVPVKAAWDVARADIGINRRAGASAVDRRVGILKISEAVSGRPIALLLRVTAHANVLTSDNFLISSDYFGAARELFEKQYGCGVMLTQGASGNIKPKYRQDNADFLEVHSAEAAKIQLDQTMIRTYFKQSLASLEKTAIALYQAVDPIVRRLEPMPVYQAAAFSEQQAFFSDVPTLKRALEIANEAKRMADIDGRPWLAEVRRLRKINILCQTITKELQYFYLNDGCLCGIPDEPMCEVALDIQKKSGDDRLFFGGYTNGYDGYLPTAEEYDKGGYEVLWSNLIYYQFCGKMMPFNRDTASILADAVSKRWSAIRRIEKQASENNRSFLSCKYSLLE